MYDIGSCVKKKNRDYVRNIQIMIHIKLSCTDIKV